ncbi:hypothetical protein RvY_01441-2 [Ramazzottius varieornatus]|uniref:Chitin-binding type-2 domain-containing protein n=1 Tax=Ramazzottius varieornatus TaxID=947166 RepID=A0A1D1URK0_RAMVA|nr:hypothetical protein RvY_01441-2 [Ramazzottius varieornatus]
MTFFPLVLCAALNFVPGIFGQSGPLIPEHGVVSVKAAHPSAAEKTNMVPPEPLLASASGNMPNYQQAGSSYGGYQGGSGGYDSGYGPGTSGGCYGRPAGYYGDADYDCKTFKVCQSDGRLDTLYCPPYTRFNNYLSVCDWHFKVDAYCNPLYKEEYNYNYESNNYGGGGYGGGGNGGGGSGNYGGSGGGSYGANTYQQPVITYERPMGSSYGSPGYGGGGGGGSGGLEGYSGGTQGYGESSGGGNGYSGGKSSGYSRPPIYNLMAYGPNSGQSSYGSGASKYRRRK